MHKLAVLVLFLFCHECSAESKNENYSCDDEEPTCATCYSKLVYHTITPDGNQRRMQEAFFPPDDSSPVYVVVNYAFKDGNGNFRNMTWYWSASTYYSSFFPLPVYQYTSLFFGDPAFRNKRLYLILEMECYNATNDSNLMQLLTQRLKLFAMKRSIYPEIDNDYDPKAENDKTVKNYHKDGSNKINVSGLLMGAQFIFPLLAMVWSFLIVSYCLFSNPHRYIDMLPNKLKKSDLEAPDESNSEVQQTSPAVDEAEQTPPAIENPKLAKDEYDKIQILISDDELNASKVQIVGTSSPANILMLITYANAIQNSKRKVQISISGAVDPADVKLCIHSKNSSIKKGEESLILKGNIKTENVENDDKVGSEKVKISIGGNIDPANVKILLSGDFSPVGVLIDGSINPDNVKIYGSNRSQNNDIIQVVLIGREDKELDVKVRLSIMFILSALFSCYAAIMSIIASDTQENLKNKMPDSTWFTRDGSLKTIYKITHLIAVEDCLVIILVVIIILAIIRFRDVAKCCALGMWQPLQHYDKKNKWWLVCAYSVVAPLTNLAIHANHIIFGFIHNQEHALSVGIFYAILLIANVHILRIIASSFLSHTPSCDKCTVCRYISLYILLFAVSIFTNFLSAFIAAIYILIPINRAFDEAPARIRLIYDTAIIGLAAGLTYWFILKKNK